jgi:hypothetical protein
VLEIAVDEGNGPPGVSRAADTAQERGSRAGPGEDGRDRRVAPQFRRRVAAEDAQRPVSTMPMTTPEPRRPGGPWWTRLATRLDHREIELAP